MSNASQSTTEMIRELRDHLEQRVLQSDDYRALMALDRHLAEYERAMQPQGGKATAAERRRHLRLLSFNGDTAGPCGRGASL